ncbi:hypothetical protein IGI04_005911 [Brassica rapa subsp. trilocularis]|uniref:CASP-like protein n=1 Tax=Brassica rapa subsp. trilocularis TaxID=1813537 RepID=A0ABQ7NFC6_BRACM|nr:hypothetical protein IGI04_005911 [Brassica rapa subsp. trilocularis]
MTRSPDAHEKTRSAHRKTFGCSCLLDVAIRLLASLTLITVIFPMALTVSTLGSSDLRFKLFLFI